MSLSSYISNLSASSKPSPIEGNRLSLKVQNRLNEAAKVRVAKILGVTRNMIDLTDDEPPRKLARLENNSRTGFRHSVPAANAPSPNPPAANLQEILRTQSIPSPQNSSHDHASSVSMDQINNRKRSASGLDQTYPLTDHLGPSRTTCVCILQPSISSSVPLGSTAYSWHYYPKRYARSC